MVRCKIKQGGHETTLEAEAPFSVSVRDAEVEFEKTVGIAMEGEGKVTIDLPATVYASKLSLQGSASLRTGEGLDLAPRARAPMGRGIQAKVLEKLTEADHTVEELADELGLRPKQVENAFYHLRKKGLVTRVGEKVHKVGASGKEPRKVKAGV